MADIAVLGTGAMGSRIAMNFVKAGHRVTVWNRTADKAMPLREFGATVARNPRAAVAESELAVAMVRDDDASRAAWLDPAAGALAAMPRGGVAIECSTLSPAYVRHLAERCASGGIGFLDAPVVGSRPQAEAARLVYLAGGDAATLARVRPVLSAAGDALHHVGPAGSGTILKLAINALFGVQVAAVAELFGWLQGAAIDLPAAIRIIGALPSCSIAAKAALDAMLSKSFAPLFPAELAKKDLDYTLAVDGDPARLPVTAAGRRRFRERHPARLWRRQPHGRRAPLHPSLSDGDGPPRRITRPHIDPEIPMNSTRSRLSPLLRNGDSFPELTVAALGGGRLSLPGDLAGSFGVVLFYRGSWCLYCAAQLSAFGRAEAALAELGIKVVALSADDEGAAAAFGAKHKIAFPIGYGADVDQIAATTGAYVNDQPRHLQSTGFVLDPAGKVLTAVYSSLAIGRLAADDVIGFVRYVRSQR